MKKILVLSGGGAKYSLEITILKELAIQGKLNNIDLIYGSSAGAIIGSILASGKMNVYELYNCQHEMLMKVFKKSWNPFKKYDSKHFAEIWLDKIGMIRMDDLITKLVVTSVDFCEKKTHFFKSWELGSMYVLPIVMRSFAAPLFFSLINDYINKKCWGDGGMTNNNLAITPSILETINLGWFNENVHFIIVGTGFVDITEPFERVSKQNTVQSVMDYINPLEGGLARMISRQEQIGQLQFICKNFPNFSFEYYDIQLPKSLNKMDAINKIDDYIKYGLIASQKPLMKS